MLAVVTLNSAFSVKPRRWTARTSTNSVITRRELVGDVMQYGRTVRGHSNGGGTQKRLALVTISDL